MCSQHSSSLVPLLRILRRVLRRAETKSSTPAPTIQSCDLTETEAYRYERTCCQDAANLHAAIYEALAVPCLSWSCFKKKRLISQKFLKNSPGKYTFLLYLANSVRWISKMFDALFYYLEYIFPIFKLLLFTH